MKLNLILMASGILGLIGVALGAFGAHGLDSTLQGLGTKAAWQTAVEYQMWHTLALLALARLPASRPRLALAAGLCFILGILLFSGSLYWLALDGPRWLGPVTPVGGLLLIVGWLLLIIYGFRNPRSLIPSNDLQ